MKAASAAIADLFYLTNRERVRSAFVKARAATQKSGIVKKSAELIVILKGGIQLRP
jgi:hypothetical protein